MTARLYLSTHDLALAGHISVQQVRNYEANGQHSRYRLYDEQQMRRLRVVALLRDAGYPFNGFFWLTRRRFVEHRLDDVEGVASVSEQGHDAQAAHLLFVVETVAAVLPIRLVIAYLLNTDVSSQCEIVGTQIETSCHVKLPGASRDFFQSTLFFLPHRASTLSL